MSGNRSLAAAKLVSILGFLVLLGSTYFLRSEVLTLNSIRFSADEARAEYELQQRKKNYPYEVQRHEVAQKNYEAARRRDRQRYEEATKNYERDLARLKERYQVAQKNYEVQEKHYRKMLELYLSDY